jgi:hypothetical protein
LLLSQLIKRCREVPRAFSARLVMLYKAGADFGIRSYLFFGVI